MKTRGSAWVHKQKLSRYHCNFWAWGSQILMLGLQMITCFSLRAFHMRRTLWGLREALDSSSFFFVVLEADQNTKTASSIKCCQEPAGRNDGYSWWPVEAKDLLKGCTKRSWMEERGSEATSSPGQMLWLLSLDARSCSVRLYRRPEMPSWWWLAHRSSVLNRATDIKNIKQQMGP